MDGGYGSEKPRNELRVGIGAASLHEQAEGDHDAEDAHHVDQSYLRKV